MTASAMGGLSHLEYRAAAAVGIWYRKLRGSSQTSGLTGAKAFTVGSELSQGDLIDAANYVFTRWFRATVVWAVLLVGYGALFDGLFYTRTSPIAFLPIAVFGAGLIGSIVETILIRTRLNFLVNASMRAGRSGYAPPKFAAPKFYDFWIGIIVTIFMLVVFVFGFVVPA